ncbi:MAG: tetratricopeptide repeat protein [Planctomycetota bacterium]
MMVNSRWLATPRWWTCLCLVLACSICVGQDERRYDFRGAQFPTGRIPADPGNVRVSGGVTFGPVGTVQQPGALPTSYGVGSSASYSNGRTFVNVGRGPAGAWHHSHQVPNGYVNQFTIVPPFIPSSPGSVAIVDGYTAGLGPHYSIVPGWSVAPSLPYGWQSNLWLGQPAVYGGWGYPGGFPGHHASGVPNGWCLNSFPYFGGTNSYFAGSVLVPTLIQMNMSMMPSVPSTASYTVTDPRMLDLLVPAPEAQGPVEPVPDIPPVPQPDADLPLLNEFQPAPRSDRVSTLEQKMQSLRYQTVGDEAFRHERYADAVVSYQSAIDAAPDRRAPWIRMALGQIAMKHFDLAIARLKTGLSMPDDAGRSWITAEELYGVRVAERARSHGLDLLNWLSERPTSADRLLLTGMFQQLRGHDEVAAELLTMSSHDGPEARLAATVTRLAHNDIGQRAAAHELAELKKEFHDRPVLPASKTRDPNGIYLKGTANQ